MSTVPRNPNPFSADPASPAVWDDSFRRLESLAGQDPAFFTLAAHSLVEAWLNALHPEFAPRGYDPDRQQRMSFGDKVRAHLDRRGAGGYEEVLRRFSSTYGNTNDVRHHFASLPVSAAKSVGENLVTLSARAGLGTPQGRKRIEGQVTGWEGRVDSRIHEEALARLRYLEKAHEENAAAFQSRLLELNVKTRENEALRRDYEVLATAHERIKDEKGGKKAELKDLQKELFDRKEALRKAEAALAEQARASEYLAELREMHQASRTRVEYEQTLIRLSTEQEDVLQSYKPGESFLVRGAAGTGKTLVLLAAIRKLRDDESSGLGVVASRKVLLVTFTKTLSRYSRYLAGLLLKEGAIDEIRTLDSLILELGRALIDPRLRLAFSDEERSRVFSGASDEERVELEDFVWAGGYRREAYLDPATRRVGRKKPIPNQERARVWERGEELLAAMAHNGLYSFNGLRSAILRRLEEGTPIPPEFALDVIAVDEVQDLGPVDLRILARLSPSLIMAGDAGQRILKQGFSFQALGIDIINRSKTLTRNFRNTRPIHNLASAFLAALNLPAADTTSCEAYRDGLAPRLFRYADREVVPRLVSDSIRFYREVLEYGESQIAILASGYGRDELDALGKIVATSGCVVIPIHDDESWIDREGIRISTIHSAKGLDFPVVIALFGKFAEDWAAEDEARRRAKANLAYVGLTRALENLTVIIPEKTSDHVLCALGASFERGNHI